MYICMGVHKIIIFHDGSLILQVNLYKLKKGGLRGGGWTLGGYFLSHGNFR